MESINKGIWKHSKNGQEITVLDTAYMEELKKDVVIYRQAYTLKAITAEKLLESDFVFIGM